MNASELKKKIIYEYDSIRKFAEEKGVNHSNLGSVLNRKQRNSKIEDFLIKEFDLPKDFFIKNYDEEVIKLKKKLPK